MSKSQQIILPPPKFRTHPLLLVLSFPSLTQPMVTSLPLVGGQAPRQIKCREPGRGRESRLLLFTKVCQVHINKLKLPKQSHGINGSHGIRIVEDRRLFPFASAMSNTYPEMTPVSAAEVIKTYYTCINKKNLEQLGIFISDNCHFEDSSFQKPFAGKKKVMHFLEQLIACMGPNVKFKLGHICEGEESTVGVDWHLEWKEYQIPFTRGSSFYECSMIGERIVIKKAQVITESPIKPGGSVLTLLKTVSFLFENFPKTAEGLLRSPRAIQHFVQQVFNIVLGSFYKPVLSFYIYFWKVIVQPLYYVVNMLFYILKIFFK